MQIKAVVFDFDNTLVATNEYTKIVVMEAAKNIGQNLDEKTVTDIQKKNLCPEEIFNELFGPTIGPTGLAEYRDIGLTKFYKANPGAIDIVQYITDKGMLHGIVTNRTMKLALRYAQSGCAAMDFMFMPLSKDLAKPNPKAFDRVLDELVKRNIGANETLSIGDHVGDYVSSNGAGLLFAAVLTGSSTKDEFIACGLDPSMIFNDLIELKKII